MYTNTYPARKCLLSISAAHIRMYSGLILSWRQTLWTLIRLLLREQSDMGTYWLQDWPPKYMSRIESRRQLPWMVGKGLIIQNKKGYIAIKYAVIQVHTWPSINGTVSNGVNPDENVSSCQGLHCLLLIVFWNFDLCPLNMIKEGFIWEKMGLTS